MRGAKKSYDSVIKENTEYFDRKREYFQQKQTKKHWKEIQEIESDSKPEVDASEYVPEETKKNL